MRTFRLFLALPLIALYLAAQPAMPRKAPELTIVEPGGKQTLLSSYRGKVVALAFIFTTCSHCQAECGVLNKLNTELGPKGFQALAVAFNDNAGMLVSAFTQTFHTNFPVGFAARQTVTDYMQLDDTGKVAWVVPQLALIDRKGMIVAQSAPEGSLDLQEEAPLRKKIVDLLAAHKTGH